MRILRVFPRKTSYTPTDDLAFVGDPPLFRPHADEVHVSVTFTWDIQEGKRLQEAWSQYYSVVRLGGPAFGSDCSTFIPGIYVKPGVTFTTRGCNNHCSWCLVPDREHNLVEIQDFAKGYIVQDNNLLQASRRHICKVFDMLSLYPRKAIFSGGLQSSLIDGWVASCLMLLPRLESVFMAADTPGSLSTLEKALKKLWFLNRRQLRVYVMIGQDIQADLERLQAVWDLGGLPFAQLYQPPDHYIEYSTEWKVIAREWSRPAAMFAQQAKKGNI